MKPELRDKLILWTSVGLFLLVNLFCMWKKEFFFIPAAALVVGVFYLLVFRVDLLMYVMAFVTPLSVVMNNEKFQIGISLPSEFIMIALNVFQSVFHADDPKTSYLKQPIIHFSTAIVPTRATTEGVCIHV